MAKTIYVVLFRTDEGHWAEDGPHQTATSATQAVRDAARLRAENDIGAEGEYVAVPLRSWAPTRVEAQVQTTLKLTEAK